MTLNSVAVMGVAENIRRRMGCPEVQFNLRIDRSTKKIQLTGHYDVIRCRIFDKPGRLPGDELISEGDRVAISGKLSSFNNASGEMFNCVDVLWIDVAKKK